MALLIDPASGWMFGFPKLYDKKREEPLSEWLVRNGYPEQMAKDVEDGKLWVRYIGNRDELDEL